MLILFNFVDNSHQTLLQEVLLLLHDSCKYKKIFMSQDPTVVCIKNHPPRLEWKNKSQCFFHDLFRHFCTNLSTRAIGNVTNRRPSSFQPFLVVNTTLINLIKLNLKLQEKKQALINQGFYPSRNWIIICSRTRNATK